MLRGVLGKTFRLVGYTIQYGCIAHCAFEYVGGVVMTCWLLCRVELILELPAYYESSSKLEEHLLDFLSFKPAQMIYILKGFQLKFKNCLSFSVLDHQWSLQFKIQILFLQKILVDIFMVSKGKFCHRGDIVIAKSPSDPKSNICKRVIGLEGDKILSSSPSVFFKSHSYVPTGHVWLEGDNLQNSTDSRYYGPVPYGLIRGRIFFKIWPLSDFGFLRDSPNGHRFSDD
ncbi:mitochondrial inner membrane protease subunit 1 isoform X1 [Monodon monoceros]|uniref:Mitochondrial inner membrane protease subunit 1 isoform X1 n=1 Tax=Delphinapterus leucas TaxID=9749 RepID=A0A2Y9P2E1_DELLE|nr:mitochondrial inner membrane protease subunit 1 isoform X1 [Delphinapterus leucas]XP_022439416.1 mitochondrial inner membrane protease subunit 1 isoform X1 [Delphinapterus leucas]XP_022439417.1 mitochondrial inner membrane protease subunit 1 isoform X1 [Delphinapterus leucas]XP_029063939.1 mitochondrial inner membrane protease subunit 1 isoform X1 [Monodon monoceros]XP_029063940.1 mitochondrial inner membrane protease subunit 1 isoform X1 [Monodon monoceros]